MLFFIFTDTHTHPELVRACVRVVVVVVVVVCQVCMGSMRVWCCVRACVRDAGVAGQCGCAG